MLPHILLNLFWPVAWLLGTIVVLWLISGIISLLLDLTKLGCIVVPVGIIAMLAAIYFGAVWFTKLHSTYNYVPEGYSIVVPHGTYADVYSEPGFIKIGNPNVSIFDAFDVWMHRGVEKYTINLNDNLSLNPIPTIAVTTLDFSNVDPAKVYADMNCSIIGCFDLAINQKVQAARPATPDPSCKWVTDALASFKPYGLKVVDVTYCN